MVRIFISKEDIEALLFGKGVNTFNRFKTFLIVAQKLPPQLYWWGLRCAYELSDNLYKYREEVKTCFNSDLPNREELMTQKEKETLKSLPAIVTIYRGMTIKEMNTGSYGVSWSLKKDIAKFFTTYFRNCDVKNEPKVIKELTIPKEKIIAYFNERDEEEVIYLG